MRDLYAPRHLYRSVGALLAGGGAGADAGGATTYGALVDARAAARGYVEAGSPYR